MKTPRRQRRFANARIAGLRKAHAAGRSDYINRHGHLLAAPQTTPVVITETSADLQTR